MNLRQLISALGVRAKITLWNGTIPERALNVAIGPTHVTYLHPTKGKRSVNLRRVGLRPEAAA